MACSRTRAMPSAFDPNADAAESNAVEDDGGQPALRSCAVSEPRGAAAALGSEADRAVGRSAASPEDSDGRVGASSRRGYTSWIENEGDDGAGALAESSARGEASKRSGREAASGGAGGNPGVPAAPAETHEGGLDARVAEDAEPFVESLHLAPSGGDARSSEEKHRDCAERGEVGAASRAWGARAWGARPQARWPWSGAPDSGRPCPAAGMPAGSVLASPVPTCQAPSTAASSWSEATVCIPLLAICQSSGRASSAARSWVESPKEPHKGS